MNAEHEVCVVGGGPAGAAVAARLAGLGHDVLVLERHELPRPHVGESLSPAVWPVLDALGASEAVAAAGYPPTRRAHVRWRAGRGERLRMDHDGLRPGLTVDRASFDAILLGRAAEAGAAVRAGVVARRPVRHADGWEVALDGGVLRTRYLVDATGRRRWLGGRRTATSPRTLALHATYRGGAAGGGDDGAQTRIEALRDGWLWGAHLPGGGFRAMAFVDPQTLAAHGRDVARLYRALLGGSSQFRELAGARPTGRVHACDATSYATPAPIDALSVKVGEAAFAIDPLSSAGVQTAMQTGLAAAAAVHTLLAPGGDGDAAIAFYRDHQRHSVARHAAAAAAVYAEHEPYGDAPFWRSRASAAPAPATATRPAPAGASLAELLARRVRLAPGAALRDTPCLVEDRVQRRRALTHPSLARPVAFLGGSELAPLLDDLPACASLADAVTSWERTTEPGRGHAIARWLHDRGLIEVAS